ncbi:MAG: GNAT family N-acetyltransferase [Candidatus Micrarchaeota archaeon]
MELTLRDVAKSDLKNIYEWRNDPRTRKWMFNDKEIKLEEHLQFWNKRISSKECKDFIIVADNEDAGLLKLDIKKEICEVGIHVAPEKTGVGIGTVALKKAIEEISKSGNVKKFIANVKSDNTASKQLFEKNGFKLKAYSYEFDVDMTTTVHDKQGKAKV